MLEPGRLSSGKTLTYASGLALGKYKGLPTVDHGGADAGYRSDLIRFPEQHFSVAVLCNTTANAGQLAKDVADVYLAASFSPEAVREEAAVALPEEKLKDKAGFYWSRETDHTLEVDVKDGKLAVVADEERLEVEPLSETRFRLKVFPLVFEFRPGKSGGRPALCVLGDDPQCFDPAERFQPPAAELSQYAGTYFSAEAEVFYRLVDENGKLVLKRLRYKPREMKPQVRHRPRPQRPLPEGRTGHPVAGGRRPVRGSAGEGRGPLNSSAGAHSARSATTGSTRVARQAGAPLASRATDTRTAAHARKVAGSRAPTP